MDMTPGLRRVPLAELDDLEPDPILVERLRDEIVATGPITFARFMERALYEPGHGYYRAAEARPGRRGDFLTAPEAHPLFGWALARQLDEIWRRLGEPDRFVLREHGAGTGTLALAILDGLDRERRTLIEVIRYEPVEVEERRLTELVDRFDEAGRTGVLANSAAGPIVGVVLANEVLDALPVHRVVVRDGRLRELGVEWRDGGFAEVELEPSTGRLEERLAAEDVRLVEGQRAEICLALDAWIADAAAGIERGVLLAIDYGHPAGELYDARRRPSGTLRAYVRHRVHDDPLRWVGRQDLTAHVDVTAVDRAAAAAGLDRLGSTSQAEFLAALDAGELLRGMQDDGATDLGAYLEARSALVRMIDPAAMGGFRVMAFGRDLPGRPPLAGFAARG